MDTPHEPVLIDGLLDMLGACVRQAYKDYAAGPGLGQHYDTARQFLDEAGLLETLNERLDISHVDRRKVA